ncbi:MAG: Mu transposase C-terminal domain-containing protein [bacterium]
MLRRKVNKGRICIAGNIYCHPTLGLHVGEKVLVSFEDASGDITVYTKGLHRICQSRKKSTSEQLPLFDRQ